ncbi:hypothetical protein BCR43DRAFT_488210 [Syncephalastrum racemosum]|uniref:EKC/KEOPS complex subunit GON7 n=1 Tax=Syncephalastrum racemosum TaxID=13706 RepID=A0A1X2HIB8_SYNRA|nr:hypothetical protein BCR43DRAFT_488210 [Syncephalastrum racemosum]
MSLKATYTSPAETRSFEHTIAPGNEQHPIQGLSAAITAMQADINQYLTQRMAQEGHSGPIQDDDDQDEEEGEEEGNEEDASSPKNKQQPGVDESNAKKQKTS